MASKLKAEALALEDAVEVLRAKFGSNLRELVEGLGTQAEVASVGRTLQNMPFSCDYMRNCLNEKRTEWKP